MSIQANQLFNISGVLLENGSLLKGVFKDQQTSFLIVLSQLAEGETLEIQGQEISMKDNMLGATLALNKWLADQEALNLQLWKIFSFEQKLWDQLNSVSS